MAAFAETRLDWLRTKIPLRNGTPSHDTFNRVLQLPDPEQLKLGLKADASRLIEHVDGQLVILDGKKLKGADPRSQGNDGLFILNAFVSDHGLCIGQTTVVDKSNEITAIPTLLGELDLRGTTVSIDAVGCQKAVAEQIVSEGADYILALKGNQADLLEEVKEAFTYAGEWAVDEQWEYDHGRYEQRQAEVLVTKGYLSPLMAQEWPSIRTLIKLTAQRTLEGVTSTATRVYISSHADKSARELAQAIRSHWSVENQLHWHLDVTFSEDACRARKGNAAVNLTTLRKMALQRIKRDDAKLSQKKRRFWASLSTDYLQRLLEV